MTLFPFFSGKEIFFFRKENFFFGKETKISPFFPNIFPVFSRKKHFFPKSFLEISENFSKIIISEKFPKTQKFSEISQKISRKFLEFFWKFSVVFPHFFFFSERKRKFPQIFRTFSVPFPKKKSFF